VVLTWSQPLSIGGQALTSFKIYRHDCTEVENEAVEIFVAPASQFTYTDLSVTGGNCYTYYVTASNTIGGESKPSQNFTVVPITYPSTPDAPTRVTHTQTSITV
jgi:fibronectin type 3 domain-containing protein